MRFFKIVKKSVKKTSSKPSKRNSKKTSTKKGKKSKRGNIKRKSTGKRNSKKKTVKKQKQRQRGQRGGYSQYGSKPMHISFGVSKNSGVSGNLANPMPYEITREIFP